MAVEKKAWVLLAILASSILFPLGRIWEQSHLPRAVCDPCRTGGGYRLLGGTCGYLPRPNAWCPECRNYWETRTLPSQSLTERWMNRIVPIQTRTVFNDPWDGAIPFNPELFWGPPR